MVRLFKDISKTIKRQITAEKHNKIYWTRAVRWLSLPFWSFCNGGQVNFKHI